MRNWGTVESEKLSPSLAKLTETTVAVWTKGQAKRSFGENDNFCEIAFKGASSQIGKGGRHKCEPRPHPPGNNTTAQSGLSNKRKCSPLTQEVSPIADANCEWLTEEQIDIMMERFEEESRADGETEGAGRGRQKRQIVQFDYLMHRKWERDIPYKFDGKHSECGAAHQRVCGGLQRKHMDMDPPTLHYKT